MIPENRFATEQWFVRYLDPDQIVPERYVDYELGGAGLNDATQGLMVQVWRAFTDKDDPLGTVYIESPTHPASVIYSAPGISDICLTFDQNMQPFLSFMQGGAAKFWWFDTSLGMYVTTTLPIGSRSPKASLDDKRFFANVYNDIVLGYIQSDQLYVRYQRDRFEVVYDFNTVMTKDLLRIGMRADSRLMFAEGLYD